MSTVPKLGRGRTGTRSTNAALEDLATLKSFEVADLPDAAVNERRLIHVSDGDTGSPCLALSDGTDWLRIALGAAVASE